MIELAVWLLLSVAIVVVFCIGNIEIKLAKLIRQNDDVLRLLQMQIDSERIIQERMRR